MHGQKNIKLHQCILELLCFNYTNILLPQMPVSLSGCPKEKFENLFKATRIEIRCSDGF